MRVVVTADTHYHPHWNAALEQMIEHIAAQKPDCAGQDGDVGEMIAGFERMLKLF